MDILEGWSTDKENHICVYISKDRKSDGNLLETVRPEHNVDGTEREVDIVPISAGIELIFLPVAAVF